MVMATPVGTCGICKQPMMKDCTGSISHVCGPLDFDTLMPSGPHRENVWGLDAFGKQYLIPGPLQIKQDIGHGYTLEVVAPHDTTDVDKITGAILRHDRVQKKDEHGRYNRFSTNPDCVTSLSITGPFAKYRFRFLGGVQDVYSTDPTEAAMRDNCLITCDCGQRGYIDDGQWVPA